MKVKYLPKIYYYSHQRMVHFFSSVDVKGCRIGATLVFTCVLITVLSLVDDTVSISLKQNIYFKKRIPINIFVKIFKLS